MKYTQLMRYSIPNREDIHNRGVVISELATTKTKEHNYGRRNWKKFESSN